MKAIILAAGLGTRLKPFTDKVPKALLEINDKPLLFYIINKLKQAGVNQIILNVHHQAEQIINYLNEHNHFDITIEISHEDDLLDTGGGLKKAGYFFDDGNPFFLHNVDVISSIDLTAMINHHNNRQNLVTLAVKNRKTSRYLLFDSNENLVGWKSVTNGQTDLSRSSEGKPEELSFLGIHVISPEIFNFLPAEKTFSIIKAYLELSAKLKPIGTYRCDGTHWFDLGRKENFIPATDYLLSLKD